MCWLRLRAEFGNRSDDPFDERFAGFIRQAEFRSTRFEVKRIACQHLYLEGIVFGRQADDEAGRLLRAAMRRHGLETQLDLSGSASSVAEIFIDAEGERAIYMAAGATAETRPEHVREDHAGFIGRAARLSTEVSQLPLDTTLAALADPARRRVVERLRRRPRRAALGVQLQSLFRALGR